MRTIWRTFVVVFSVCLMSLTPTVANSAGTLKTTTMSKLLKSVTRSDTENPGALANVFTPVPSSTTSVTCPATETKCTIEIVVGVQFTGASQDNNTFAACPKVDGVLVDRCPVFGKLLNFLSIETRTWVFYVGNVKPGKHTVVLQFFSQPANSTVREYNMKTSIYAP